MASVKIMVLYPPPSDPAEFDKRYAAEHVPLVFEHFPTMQTFRTTRVLAGAQGPAAYTWVAELHFASMEDLQAAMGTEGAQVTVGHAMEISTGGPPTVLICEDSQVVTA